MKTLEREKIIEKNGGGGIYKTTPISATINYKFPNLVPNQSLDNLVYYISW